MIRTAKQSKIQPRTINVTPVSLLIVIFACMLTACGNNRAFNSDEWLKGDRRSRGRMCEDLVGRRILIGQTEDEAQRLLGRPDTVYPRALSYNIDMGLPFK